MILAAGYGTRLWPLTVDRAKPAVPFFNRPLISYSMDYLLSAGTEELIVNLHHQPETVRVAVEAHCPPHLKVHFSFESEILGTGGALDRVRSILSDSTFVVINGKIITSINLAEALETHRRRAALATLVLRPNPAWERFSQVDVDSDGRILGFSGFPQTIQEESGPPPLMFTGIQILEPRIFDYIPRSRFSHTTSESFPLAIEHGETIIAHTSADPWYELSTLQRYLDVHVSLLKRNQESVILGRDSRVENGAQVAESVLWNHVQVETGASLHRCIVGDHVVIPAGAVFDNVAIVRRSLCPEPERGEIIGENLVVPFIDGR